MCKFSGYHTKKGAVNKFASHINLLKLSLSLSFSLSANGTLCQICLSRTLQAKKKISVSRVEADKSIMVH